MSWRAFFCILVYYKLTEFSSFLSMLRQFTIALLLSLPVLGFSQMPFLIDARLKTDIERGLASGVLEDLDKLGTSFAPIGALGPSGTVVAVGVRGDDNDIDGFENAGAIWLMQIADNGKLTVINTISSLDIPSLDEDDNFGEAITNLGDINGDGIPELAVGAPFDSLPFRPDIGSVYILTLDSDAELESFVQLQDGLNGIPPLTVDAPSKFGSSLAAIDDLDGNGVREIAVGAPATESESGAILILFMRPDGTVGNVRRIDSVVVGADELMVGDLFGQSMAFLGDITGSGDGILAVGSHGLAEGHIRLLAFDSAGIPTLDRRIDATDPVLAGRLDFADAFGYSMANIGDLDGDGIPELAVGAPGDDDSDDGINDKGAVWILFFQDDGTLRGAEKISTTVGGFSAGVQAGDFFANAVGGPGDIDGDGIPDLLIGARNDKATTGERPGSFYTLKVNYCRVPGNRFVSSSLGTTSFSWDPVPNGLGYIVQYQNSLYGGAGWTSEVTTDNTLDVDTLEPGETYDWRVSSICGSTQSFPSDEGIFFSPRLGKFDMQINPNPVAEELNLSLAQIGTDARIEVLDMTGKVLYSLEPQATDAMQQIRIEEIRDWPAGSYLLRYRDADQQLSKPFHKL